MIRRLIPAAVFSASILNTAHAREPVAHADEPVAPAIDADAALTLLKEGNARFVQGESTFPNLDQDRRCNTTDNGQHPYASILSCADSRVPPELVFDAGIGEIFAIRVAGNVADTDEIGTLEYGAGHLHTPLIVVMGHTKCGAVTAVVKGAEVHGSIPKLVDNIIPAVELTREKFSGVAEAKFIQFAIKENVRQSMADILRNSEEIRELVSEGKVRIVGAVYDIHNGTIEWLGDLPNQTVLLGEAPAGHGEDLIHDNPHAADAHSETKAVSHAAKADAHESQHATNLYSDTKPAKDDAHGVVTASRHIEAKVDSHAKATVEKGDSSHETHSEASPKKTTSSESRHGESHSAHEEPEAESHGEEHSESSHAAQGESHALVDKEQTLVQKHGLLVPAAFLAAGSMLSGTVVLLLKSKGGHTVAPAETNPDDKHETPAKPAH